MGGQYCAINSPFGPRWGQKSLDLRSLDFCPHLGPRGELIAQYRPPMSFRYIICQHPIMLQLSWVQGWPASHGMQDRMAGGSWGGLDMVGHSLCGMLFFFFTWAVFLEITYVKGTLENIDTNITDIWGIIDCQWVSKTVRVKSGNFEEGLLYEPCAQLYP